jgi:hypothetical protein
MKKLWELVNKACAATENIYGTSNNQNIVDFVCIFELEANLTQGPSWMYGSWIHNYLCNHNVVIITSLYSDFTIQSKQINNRR